MTGLTLGILGLALTALMCGIGSGIGLKYTSTATAGVVAEDPKKRSKVMLLTLLPATQGLYGFVIAIIGASVQLPTTAKIAGFASSVTDPVLSAQVMTQGWNIFMACLPMMLGGMISAILQGKASAATIIAVGKNSEASKAFLFPAMIEFYALLGMVASILLLFNIPVASIPSIPVAPATEATAALATLVVG